MTAGRSNKQNKLSWNTPSKYADLIHRFFNYKLDLDPCSNVDSIIDAKTKFTLPLDGLLQNWSNNTIYINPPYGRDYERKTSIKNWIRKAYEAHIKYSSEILMLIPVATNTSHWKEYIFKKAYICFLHDTRLVFRINKNENNKGSPMACAMIYYGKHKNKFVRTFGDFGFVVE